MTDRPVCTCLDAQYTDGRWAELRLHDEAPDPTSPTWLRLLDLIDRAAADGRTEFNPGAELGWDAWRTIVALPPTVGKLTAVRTLVLYGSGLVRLPPEVGGMTALEDLDLYTSYRLHWLPYEVTRCPRLVRSRVSTRALYDNYKYRPPFPRLPHAVPAILPARCGVCDGPFGPGGPWQRWISLRVATDVLPLLVHACSAACLDRLPPPADGYITRPHRGGLGQPYPPRDR